jgi:hypothetical protein
MWAQAVSEFKGMQRAQTANAESGQGFAAVG